MSKNEQNIRIEWDGPYNISDIGYVEEKEDYIKSEFNKNIDTEDSDRGIYQVYGYHPVYGDNVLLYIGKTCKQTFAKRLSQEGWEYNQDYKNIQFYVGRLFSVNEEAIPSYDEWDILIDKAERMLIYAHKPAQNSSNILSIRRGAELKEFENIRIFNYDNCRSLIPEISGDLWIKEFLNYRIFGT